MPRGGHREGAGAKSKWIHGKTIVVRIPESLSDEVLRLARILDEGGQVDDVTKSKYLNLSGISLRYVSGRPAVFIEDLLRAGFKIRPLALIDKIRKEIDKGGVNA